MAASWLSPPRRPPPAKSAKSLLEWRPRQAAQSEARAGRATDGQRQSGAHRVSAKLAEVPPLAVVVPRGPCGRPISLQTLGPRAERRKGDIAVVLRPRREHT